MMNRILSRSIGLYKIHPEKVMSKQAVEKRSSNREKQVGNKEDSISKCAILLNNADIQVIGSHCQGYSPCLLVNSEGNSYLFNCSEGTQRFCYANKIKILNIRNVFITQPRNWDLLSGAYGLSLTLQDVGVSNLTLHSPQNIDRFFESTNPFLSFSMTGMKCSSVNTEVKRRFSDNGISIDTLIIKPSLDSSSGGEILKKFKSSQEYTIIYLCKLPDLLGALDPQKCRDFKVPIGPLLAQLKSGKDITLNDGTVVKSRDVCKPKIRGTSFLVVDCPTMSHAKNLFESKELLELRRCRAPPDEQHIDLVVHFSPEEIYNNSDYQNWMRGFSDSCKHLLLSNRNSRGLNFDQSYRFQYLLQQIDGDMFKDLAIPDNKKDIYRQSHDIITDKSRNERTVGSVSNTNNVDDDPETITRKDDIENLDRVYPVEHLDKFYLRPHKFVESLDVLYPIDEIYNSLKENIEFEDELKKLRELQETLPKSKEYEPEVVFLGTGSAQPAKYRNTSCIVLNFEQKDVSILLDCGEDSHGQLHRYYGPDGVDKFLKRLRMIYISHHHVDHHIGLVKILSKRKQVVSTIEPVVLIAPPSLEKFLNYYSSKFEDIRDTYSFFANSEMRTTPTKSFYTPSSTIQYFKEEVYKKMNGFLSELTIVPVEHCVNACAVVMKFAIGHQEMETFTLGYSGDARPSEDFVIAGRNCDLLIHEATMDFRSREDAIMKKHSTSSEAIEVGRKMEAKFTLLTHFSQRLSKIPYFNDEFDDKVGFAFDNMSIRCPSQFLRIPIMKPALKAAFQKELSEIELKFWKQDAKKKILQEALKQM